MLTKRQLEDMVRCNIHSDCSNKAGGGEGG